MSGFRSSHSRPPAQAGTFNNLRRTKEALRKELRLPRSLVAFDRAKTSQPVLAVHASPLSVLAVLSDDSHARYPEKEAILRALLSEYQGNPSPLWSTLLLVAYHPAVCKLRERLRSESFGAEDLDLLVEEKFLEVAAGLPLSEIKDRICMRLRQGTERAVFRVLKDAEVQRRLFEFMDDDALANLDPAAWPEACRRGKVVVAPDEADVMVSLLVRHAGTDVPQHKLDVVLATTVRGECLHAYVEHCHPQATGAEHKQVYGRIKRERSRTIQVLRRLLADLVVPE